MLNFIKILQSLHSTLPVVHYVHGYCHTSYDVRSTFVLFWMFFLRYDYFRYILKKCVFLLWTIRTQKTLLRSGNSFLSFFIFCARIARLIYLVYILFLCFVVFSKQETDQTSLQCPSKENKTFAEHSCRNIISFFLSTVVFVSRGRFCHIFWLSDCFLHVICTFYIFQLWYYSKCGKTT